MVKKLLIALTLISFAIPTYTYAVCFTATGFGESGVDGFWMDNEVTVHMWPSYVREGGTFFVYKYNNERTWLMSDVIGDETNYLYYDDPGFEEYPPSEGLWVEYIGASPAGSFEEVDCETGEGGGGLGIYTSTSTVPYGDWLMVSAIQIFLLAFLPITALLNLFRGR